MSIETSLDFHSIEMEGGGGGPHSFWGLKGGERGGERQVLLYGHL